MESEITLKSLEWKEGKGDKGPWRMLKMTDSGGLTYSAFSNQISGEALELINRLKPGDALKISFEMAKTKTGQDVRNLKGILDYEPAQEKTETSQRQESGKVEMSKADWTRKDNQYYWTQLAQAIFGWAKEGQSFDACVGMINDAFDQMKTKVNEEEKE